MESLIAKVVISDKRSEHPGELPGVTILHRAQSDLCSGVGLDAVLQLTDSLKLRHELVGYAKSKSHAPGLG